MIARRHRLKREKRSAFRLALGAALFFALIVPVNPAASADALAEADALIRDVEALWAGGDRMVIDAKLRRALEIREALCGPDSPLVADVLGRLGRNAWNRRDLTTAEQMFRRALAIDEQAQPDSFDTARLLGDLGATLRERRDYGPAEALVRRSIDIRRRLSPPHPPFVAGGLQNLAQILEGRHRYAEAAEAMQESLLIRRASLGADHPQTRQSEAHLAMLQNVLDPWRIVAKLGWLMAACALGAILVVGYTVHAERGGNPGRSELLRFGLTLACAGAAAYCAAEAAAALLPAHLPDLGDRNLRKLNWLAGLLMFGGMLSAILGLANVARRMAGLPPRFGIDEADVRQAVRVGKLWVNAPALILLLGGLALFGVAVSQVPGVESKGAIGAFVLLVVIVASTGVAWLWWSIMAPRWQVWAMRRVGNLDSLAMRAVEARILWPASHRVGRLFTRTAWWTPALQREAETIMATRAIVDTQR